MNRSFDRRAFLAALGGAGASLVTGCHAFPAASGVAYEPWEFPLAGDTPENEAAHAALLAASPHDTQPWALRVTPGRIDLFADPTRHLGAMDSLRREMHLGLGCALENLVVAARARGRAASVALLPDAADPTLVARVDLTPARAVRDGRFEAIARRHTNRGAYLDSGAPPGLEPQLRALIADDDVDLAFLAGAAERRRFADGTVAATVAINADEEMSDASYAWYRHTKEEIDRLRDGVTLDASGNGATLRFLGKSVGRPSAASAGDYWLSATRDRQLTGAAYGLLSSRDRDDRAQQLRVGRTFQRIHLWATAEGLALQPLNQMPERQDREQTEGLAPTFGPALAALSGQATSTVQMAFRIGVAWDDALESPRRPLAWVLR
jgi:hypothetical protein